jgi:hypothetical protein
MPEKNGFIHELPFDAGVNLFGLSEETKGLNR